MVKGQINMDYGPGSNTILSAYETTYISSIFVLTQKVGIQQTFFMGFTSNGLVQSNTALCFSLISIMVNYTDMQY